MTVLLNGKVRIAFILFRGFNLRHLNDKLTLQLGLPTATYTFIQYMLIWVFKGLS